MQYNVM